ncbi:ABC transporter permease [Streptoalloteichus hindustanus]|uniref:Uncharacterized protein family (UPF0014) n=1 Tax=Streptoalloteichus hindustanus TaxID=2017 RepID=A0A1M5PKW5_STRHI|nr:ABC transporter permease [Streptoalloteichus hindustanus]SHH01883.1 Uncharacterised protein family (UPF0014) [Streptoalloteichus hindustanus]
MISVDHGWVPFVLVCVVFVAATALVGRAAGLFAARPVLWAAVRAVVQLAVVSTVVAGVLASLPLSASFVLLMSVVATITAARRAKATRVLPVGLAVLGGALPALGVLVASGLVPPHGAAVLPMGGILIGGAMTATTLSARRALDVLDQRHGVRCGGFPKQSS